MEPKRNAPASDTSSGRMPKKAARHPVQRAQKPEWAVTRALRGTKVIIVDYDEETFARFQALVASYATPKTSG